MKQHDITEQAYKNGYNKGYEDGKKDAVKHGRWFRTGAENVYGGIEIQCSECGHTFMTSPMHIEEEHFCCKCGSRMDGAEDGN